jgi:regulation of enolase protein 1 (concanavalin A-like superfamily)
MGLVGVTGSAAFTNGTFTVNGSGQQIWGTADSFNFAYQTLSGDGSIVARVVSLTSAASAGVMIRETLNAGSTNIYPSFYQQNIYMNYRPTTAGSTSQAGAGGATLPYWVKAVRSGSTLSGYTSADGVNWVLISSQTISMGQNVYIGLAVCSGNNASLATASFDNVSVNSTAAPAPMISSVSATTGSVGSPVVISGSGFGTSQGGSAVMLNGAPVTINSWSSSSITVTIPSGATSGSLAVSVAPSMNDSNPVTFTVTSQPLPTPWLDQDIGQVGLAGSGTFANGTFTVKGAGTSAWNAADGVHFVYQPLMGDATIVARVVSVSTSSTGGVMIRDTLNASAMSTFVAPYGSQIYFNYRTTTGGPTAQFSTSTISLPYWVKVTRSGSLFSSYTSADGVNWVQFGSSQTINMGQNVYIGLAVSSGSTSALATATFDNVLITTP